MVCEIGDKPKIKYKFGQGKEQTYESQYAPIEVTTKEIPADASDNYNSAGYQITTANYVGGTDTIIIVDHKLITIPRKGQFDPPQYYLCYILCGQTTYTKYNPCSSTQAEIDCNTTYSRLVSETSFTINPLIKCPSANKKRCSIEVKFNGLIIFQAQGDCPCSYSVQCGSCPEGSHECKHQAYPGYCCVPCKETGEKLKNIASSVRG